MSKVVRDKETNEDIILDPEKDLNIVLPGYKCHAYISIFEDAINQLAVLADVVPLGFQGTSKDVIDSLKKKKNLFFFYFYFIFTKLLYLH